MKTVSYTHLAALTSILGASASPPIIMQKPNSTDTAFFHSFIYHSPFPQLLMTISRSAPEYKIHITLYNLLFFVLLINIKIR